MEPNSRSDENFISLYDFLSNVWNGKWIIFATTSFAAIIALSIALTLPDSFYFRITVKPAQEAKFLPLTEINKIVAQETGANYQIMSKYVYDLFIDEISDKIKIQNMILNDTSISDALQISGTESQKSAAAKIYSENFSVTVKPIVGTEIVNHYLEFNSGSNIGAEYFLTQIINKGLSNVKNVLINDLETISGTMRERLTREKDNLVGIISALNHQGVMLMNQRLEILSEQAAIANKMGIASTLVERFDNSDAGYPLDFGTNGTPLYLRGYIALEKEIENLKTKISEKNVLGYQPYLDANRDLQLLEQNNSVAQLNRQIEFFKSNVGVENWISHDLNAVIPRKTPSRVLILAVAIIAGFVAGVFIVMFKQQKGESIAAKS